MSRPLDFLRRVPAAVAWRAEVRTRGVRERARKVTAPLRLRPNFLVIGAQKSGTTALHAYLSEHPAVFCTSRKEVHYFSLTYPLGERWYLSHFALRGVSRPAAVGESTPAYLFDPRSPARVHAFDPRMKLVAVLRDPVERAYSHYWMERETRDETRSFEDALEWEQREVVPELERWIADPAYESPLPLFGRSYVSRGLYAEQLERWLELFPREQMLVFTSDELTAEPAETMAFVARFLGAPPVAPVSYPRENVREYEPMAAETRQHLRQVFEPHNRRLEELLGRTLPW
ncbi:MAG TPA: sulfotransferase domain-containing protein [Gaiellaceae bacterium]|nr:sulfotransferase domain-containing protein [Gaiellaceae bacterium]